ncbi:TRAP transporter permease [Roseospirillum parvum]|uniref:TRAP transporter, 4TM/12TM fusion protein n=1 Tax=Roseospirillum parvum TaxID=83401 RepID=A0A1G7WL85_9PROT|nr:TRAP transporter permease [Roseospirillum parvum]SDG72693.1 TRAP transporter, 4TM/12TM fusion protein [Roseospirillum parvum]
MAEDNGRGPRAAGQGSGVEAEDLVAQVETGARHPSGMAGRALFLIALAWALFQLWFASPLPFILGFGILNNTEARSIHLGFAIFLAYTAFPAFKNSPRLRVPLIDWLLAFLAAGSALYLFVFYEALADRPGAPTQVDVIVGVVGLITLLEATRRALGPPLMIVATVFMGYAFLGQHMPDVIAHQGASLNKGMSHYWLGTEGVFGVALGVSTTMVFLFVAFGSLLEKAGAGNWFIRVAFSMLGHFRGGPAKAAVVSSALTGLISGSSIANVVTTGTFTIPLMKRVGFPAEKAGAVEVASSTNGQLTPPIMGAAAFLMVEYVGISLVDVMRHAVLPALISYIALVYIVHLEALKLNLKGLPRSVVIPKLLFLAQFLGSFAALGVLSAATYFGLGWTKEVFGGATPYIASAVLLVAYVALVAYACRFPDLDTSLDIQECPAPGPTIKAGLHFLLPVAVLVWCLTVERLSPGLSAFWAAVFMIFIVLTQPALKAFFRRTGPPLATLVPALAELIDGLVAGSRNMIGIGVATAAAGIVVGTITLTGIGQVMTEFVEFISAGNLVLMLLFTAVISLILGMGLPTTANYIVVSSLMAPVIVTLAADNGLLVPLIAAHMFVFYFGILADDTPPVGLAAFAAAAISKGDPIRTGLQGFAYDIRTAILPFLFIFNTELLLIGVESIPHALMVFVSGVLAMLAFASATQNYMFVRNRIWETAILLLAAFTLFRPGYWMDMAYPPLLERPSTAIVEVAEGLGADQRIKLKVSGVDFYDNPVEKTVALNMGAAGPGEQRLEGAGLFLRQEGDHMVVDDIGFGSQAERMGIDYDFVVEKVFVENTERPPKHLMYIPAVLLIVGVALLQRRRQKLLAR